MFAQAVCNGTTGSAVTALPPRLGHVQHIVTYISHSDNVRIAPLVVFMLEGCSLCCRAGEGVDPCVSQSPRATLPLELSTSNRMLHVLVVFVHSSLLHDSGVLRSY